MMIHGQVGCDAEMTREPLVKQQ